MRSNGHKIIGLSSIMMNALILWLGRKIGYDVDAPLELWLKRGGFYQTFYPYCCFQEALTSFDTSLLLSGNNQE